MSTGLIIAVLVLAVIIALFVWFYRSLPITDCAVYGNPNLPGCPTGKAEYGGVCYTDNWTALGGTKTLLCTVSYKGDGSTFTPPTYVQAIYDLDTGMSCDNIKGGPTGTGWIKNIDLQSQTCQRGGSITAEYYCADSSLPNTCAADEDFFEGVCYKSKCPSGYIRSEICTCSSNPI